MTEQQYLQQVLRNGQVMS